MVATWTFPKLQNNILIIYISIFKTTRVPLKLCIKTCMQFTQQLSLFKVLIVFLLWLPLITALSTFFQKKK